MSDYIKQLQKKHAGFLSELGANAARIQKRIAEGEAERPSINLTPNPKGLLDVPVDPALATHGLLGLDPEADIKTVERLMELMDVMDVDQYGQFLSKFLGENQEFYNRLDPQLQTALLNSLEHLPPPQPAPEQRMPGHPWANPGIGVLGPGHGVPGVPQPGIGRLDESLYPRGAGPMGVIEQLRGNLQRREVLDRRGIENIDSSKYPLLYKENTPGLL